MSFEDFFRNKTITQLGLGLLGRGVGDAAFLAKYCKKLIVTDTKTEEELQISIEALKEYRNIEFVLGVHNLRNFEGIDFVIKAAGVRLDNPYVAHAQKHGIPIYMSSALFAKLVSLPVIGVTGSRGKTTTTLMLAEILKRARKRVLLGGNLRGISTLGQLPKENNYDVALLELDSWQLQGFDALKISPHIAVFTTFYPDHMNYYDDNMQRYFEDKAAIFRHQKADDTLVTTDIITEQIRHKLSSTVKIAKPLPSDVTLKTPGEHNRLNAALAAAAGRAYGIDEKIAMKAVSEFTAVEGRLQHVGTWKKRAIYNDNNATTQEATLAALCSFHPSSVVLIFGGSDKGLPIADLLAYITQHKIRSVLLNGSGSDRILKVYPALPQAASMQEAVQKATKLSKPGDTIILSPAFASFGLFMNEYDRNDQFINEIRALMSRG